MISADEVVMSVSQGCEPGIETVLATVYHPEHSPDFPGKSHERGTGSRMIGAVRASPGKLLASAAEVTDLSESRFRYRICGGVLPWTALALVR
jgi:hypothetical protein